MVCLIGIVEQNENVEINNQFGTFDIVEQNCVLSEKKIPLHQYGDLYLDPQHTLDFESENFINTKKLYKIWFNKDPDIFLIESNKERLVKLRQDNLESQISLLYSAGRLSDKAKNEMQEFLSDYSIKAVDFDQIYEEVKNDESNSTTELNLVSLAKEELDNFGKGNDGGNPAAASDLLRVSKTIIERLGIYSDMDVHLKFNNLPLFLKTETPMIVPNNNNDFIAFSCGRNCESISAEAEKQLIHIQNIIIENYNSYVKKNTSVTEYRASIKNMDIYDLFRYYHMEYHNEIFSFNKQESEKVINLLDNLSKGEIVELFFELSPPHSIAYYLSIIANNYIASNWISSEIRNEPQAYGARNESLLNTLFNETLFNPQLLVRELYNVGAEEVNTYEFWNSPTEYQKDDMLSNELKQKYHELFINALLESYKFTSYVGSVMYESGPGILQKFFNNFNRDEYTPIYNHIEDSLIVRNGQDGSWYINKL